MSAIVGTSGGNKTATAITVGTSGGNKAVIAGFVGTPSGNKQFFASLSASAAPSSVSGTRSGAGSVTTNTTTVTVTGAVGALSYLWEYVSGDASISPTAGTLATTAFSTTVTLSQTKTAVWRCRVTDAGTGAVAYSNDVSVAAGEVS